MASINDKMRYISTISRKNRGLWTVYITSNYKKKNRDVLSFFEIKTRNIHEFFASSEEKKTFQYSRTIACTIQLLRNDTYCPITLSY